MVPSLVSSQRSSVIVPSLQSDGARDLGDLLRPIIAQAGIPGVAAVVLRGDRIVAQGSAGVRKQGGTERITLGDKFELCSCTKAMTATLVALLVDEGRLRWDSTLTEIFGDALPGINPAWHTVTVRQMLAHRAGLTDHWVSFLRSVDSNPNTVAQQRRVYVERVLASAPSFPSGTKFYYNSTDYLVAAAALEKITGRSYEELIRERLFQPLGLTTGGFGPPGTPGQVDQPLGHGVRRLFYVPLVGTGAAAFDPGSKGADYPLAASPGGLVHLSVLDWAQFVSLHLRGDPANPNRSVVLLRPDTFAALHQSAPGENYAGGWFTGTRPWANGNRTGDTGRVIYHEGDNGRWTCVVWVAPEIDFAILIACNRADMHSPCDAIAGALLKNYLVATTHAN